MAREKTIQLHEPVQFGSETVEELTMSFKLKHLRGHALRIVGDGKGGGGLDLDFGTLIDLAAKLIGRTPAFLDELCDADQSAILQEARDFLLSRLATGLQA